MRKDMGFVTTTAAKEICEALGLENVTNLEIKMKAGDVSRITVESFLLEGDMNKITPILKKYKLVPLDDEMELPPPPPSVPDNEVKVKGY